MNGEEFRAREKAEEDEREADDKVNEVRLQVQEEITRADGEHAPFRDEDEDKTDKPASGDETDKNRTGAEKDVHEDVKHRRERVATFTDKDVVICHIFYYSKTYKN